MWKHYVLTGFFSFFLCLPLNGYENDSVPQGEVKPWFTGPLLAPSSSTVGEGRVVLQPYFFSDVQSAHYDSHWKKHPAPTFTSLNPELVAIFGLRDDIDFIIIPQSVYNRSRGFHSGQMGDLTAGFNYQVRKDDPQGWKPSIKLNISETFPTGNYQKLHANRALVDISGLGSYITSFTAVFHKLFHIRDQQFLSFRLGSTFSYLAPVHVSGFNSYGGGVGTRGKVRPGNAFSAIFSFEYSFTQNWAFAMDSLYVHTNRDRFSGTPGVVAATSGSVIDPNLFANVGTPSSESISFAPAIEYNFAKNFGIIAGVWFTACGRNSPKFASAVVSIVYSFELFKKGC